MPKEALSLGISNANTLLAFSFLDKFGNSLLKE